MNNYQKALNYINKSVCTLLALRSIQDIQGAKNLHILQEAVDKANKYDELQTIFDDRHICEIKSKFNKLECNADKCDTCPLQLGDDMCLKITFENKWNFQKERDELKQKLVDKETPKKVSIKLEGGLYGNDFIKECPICEEWIYTLTNYCHNCGQKLDWSDD